MAALRAENVVIEVRALAHQRPQVERMGVYPADKLRVITGCGLLPQATQRAVGGEPVDGRQLGGPGLWVAVEIDDGRGAACQLVLVPGPEYLFKLIAKRHGRCPIEVPQSGRAAGSRPR